jgi:hypothetical protein
MMDTENKIIEKVKEYTPLELYNLMKSLGFRTPPEKIIVKGIIEDDINKKNSYDGYKYISLKDYKTGTYIKLRIPENLTAYLKTGEIIKLIGIPYIDFKPKFSKAEIVLEVSDILGIEEKDKVEERSIELELIKLKNQKGYKNVEEILLDKLLKGEKPNIAIIIGNTAIVDKDILEALGKSQTFYNLEFIRTNLINVESIISTVKDLDKRGYDLITIARGGGDGIEPVFNNEKLLRELLDMETPLAVAIGHAEDTPLIELIADTKFITPTHFGNFLKKLTEKVYEIKKFEEEKEYFLQQIEELKKEKAEKERKLEILQELLKEYETKINKLELEKLYSTNSEVNIELEKLRKERENLISEIEKLKQMNDNITKLYKDTKDRLLLTLKSLEHREQKMKIYIVIALVSGLILGFLL